MKSACSGWARIPSFSDKAGLTVLPADVLEHLWFWKQIQTFPTKFFTRGFNASGIFV